jgi:hypothetical protein
MDELMRALNAYNSSDTVLEDENGENNNKPDNE